MDSQRTNGRSLRGFASMDRSKQKEIASKGGRAAHEKGTAHEFSKDEAALAAKRGHERGTAHEFTPEEARVAGRKGGMARAANRDKNSGGEAVGPAQVQAAQSVAPGSMERAAAGEIPGEQGSGTHGGYNPT